MLSKTLKDNVLGLVTYIYCSPRLQLQTFSFPPYFITTGAAGLLKSERGGAAHCAPATLVGSYAAAV